MRKPNPLHTVSSTIWMGFKYFTAAVGEIGGVCVLVGSLVFLGEPLGMACLVVGGLMFYMGKNLTKTLQAEASGGGDDSDEGSDLPLGTV